METLSFALGMASVGVLLIVVALIWVLLRVKEIVKEQNNTIESLLNLERILTQRMDNSENHYSDEIKEVYNRCRSTNADTKTQPRGTQNWEIGKCRREL